MVKRYFRGDKVKTNRGIGRVHKVVTWRDRIVDMTDAEAKEFSATCRLRVGQYFREDWVELLVAIGKTLVRVQAKDVELIEGRDHDENEGLA